MKWSRELHGRWMGGCFLCKGYVEEEICSPLERHYECTNSGCTAHFRLYVSHPRTGKDKGAFGCLVSAQHTVIQEGMRALLYEELYASCLVCERTFVDRGDGILVCPDTKCGTSVEFYLEKLPLSFVAFLVLMRIPEPGFSKILVKTMEPHRYN